MMKPIITPFLILFIAFQAKAQEFFRPTGLTATEEAHKTFMAKHQVEATKRAVNWKVPPVLVQVIASVQSGAGTKAGYNFGEVLPAPGITRYPKLSKVDSDGLLLCIKTSRGMEAIALSLSILNANNKNTLKTDRDYMQVVFGAGGELVSMASEAEKAYMAHMNKKIKLSLQKGAIAATLGDTSQTAISDSIERSIEQQQMEMAETAELETEDSSTPAIPETNQKQSADTSTVITVLEIGETMTSPQTTLADNNNATEARNESEMEEEVEIFFSDTAIEMTEAEQKAALAAAQLKASQAAELEVELASQAAAEKRKRQSNGEVELNPETEAKLQARLEAEKRKSEIDQAEQQLKADKKERARKQKIKKENKQVVIDDKVFADLTGNDPSETEEMEIRPVSKRKIRFGIRGGVNATKLLVENDVFKSSENDEYKIGALGGLVVDFPIARELSVELGALFSMKGSKYKAPDGDRKSSLERNINYINVPIHLKKFANNGRSDFFFQAGPYVGIAINGTSKATINEAEESTDISIGSAEDDFIKQLDYGFGAGFGIQFGGVQVGLSYDFGLANLTNETVDGAKMKNQVASLWAGYLF